MASLTIRKLDDAIKAYLRLRSAKNGRSVEEEVRVILRETWRAVRRPPRPLDCRQPRLQRPLCGLPAPRASPASP